MATYPDAPELAKDSPRSARWRLSDSWFGGLLVAPALIIIVFFALFPLAYAIFLAAHHVDLTAGGIGDYVGLASFRYALSDAAFAGAVRVTLVILAASLSIEIVLGITLAVLLFRLKWFKGPIRALFLLPLAAAPLAAGLIWRYMYDSEFGVFNDLLRMAGLDPVNWLGDARMAVVSVVAFDVWQWTPFVALIALAGLQSLPREPFEAAELDGAARWTVFRRLTMPLLTPVLALIVVLRMIDLARLYDPVAAMTRGGPGASTETLSFYLYRVGLQNFRLDQASAMALIVLFAIIVVSGVGLRPLMRQQAERARRS